MPIVNGVSTLVCQSNLTATAKISNYQGDLVTGGIGSAELAGEGISEISTYDFPLDDIPLFAQNITVSCCNFTIPLTLEFRHQLNSIMPLKRFLNQNNVFLPGLITSSQSDYIKLNFSEYESAWVGNVHLKGDSPVGNGQESWDMNFSFECDTSGTWNFLLSIFVNRPTQKIVSTFAASFPSIEVCNKNSNTFMKFAFVLKNGVTVPAASVVVNDEVKLFRNLRMPFRILSQGVSLPSQLDEDNTAAFIATLGDVNG